MNLNSIYIKLLREVTKSISTKSSYWRYHSIDFSVNRNNISNSYWGNIKFSYLINYFHLIAHKIFYFNKYYNSNKIYQIMKMICLDQNRFFDYHAIRHVFVLKFLKNNINNFNSLKNICIIGDGNSNMVSLLKYYFNKKINIFLINLPEVMISDLNISYQSLKKKGARIILYDDSKINFFLKQTNNIILVPSNKSDFLLNKNIKLFINIHSFQEMDKFVIKKYFNIIKSNKSYIYSCNREHKKLYVNESIMINEFLKNGLYVNHNSVCEWDNFYYTKKFPFLKKNKHVTRNIIGHF